jgi:hypothetical protein
MYVFERRQDEVETASFPRWRNGETSDRLDVKPEKLKAMIFCHGELTVTLTTCHNTQLPVGQDLKNGFPTCGFGMMSLVDILSVD